MLVAYEREGVASGESLREIAAFSEELSAVPGINPASTQDLARTLSATTASVLQALPRLLRVPAIRAIRDKLIHSRNIS